MAEISIAANSVDASKATVISLCPFPINEFKPGLIPNRFNIPAAKNGDIEVLVIPNDIKARMRVPVIGNSIDINVLATTIAKSIVDDRATGQLLYSAEAKPGLFWVPGEWQKEVAKVKFKVEIAEADRLQKEWYLRLIKRADDDWAQYRQHKYITDLQRHAAKSLGISKEWTMSVTDSSTSQCVACFAPINPKAIICPTCKTNQQEFLNSQKK